MTDIDPTQSITTAAIDASAHVSEHFDADHYQVVGAVVTVILADDGGHPYTHTSTQMVDYDEDEGPSGDAHEQ